MSADQWTDAYRLHEREWSGYEQLRDEFDWHVPDRFNIAAYTTERWRGSDRLALVAAEGRGSEQRYTFTDLDRAADQLANALVADGIERGDRVAVAGRQHPVVATAHLAAWKCGAVTVPVSPLLGTGGLRYRLQDSGATAAVFGSSLLETLDDIDLPSLSLDPVYAVDGESPLGRSRAVGPLLDGEAAAFETVDTAADEPASVFYTSGSTGDPKGVVLPHRTLLGILPAYLTLKCDLELSGNDHFWTTSEWSWIALYSTVFTSWFYGMSVLAYDRGAFDADEVWHVLNQYGVTSLSAAPAALRRLRDAPAARPVDSVRVVFSGGSLLREPTVEWARQTFGPVSVHVSYGLTEAALVSGNCEALGKPYRPATIGVAQPGHELRLVDPDTDDHEAVPRGDVGEVAVRAASDPVCMDRYWQKPGATNEALRDGWLLTNDLGRRTAEGYIKYIGRADDVIISSGYRVGPAEIERTLGTHDAVKAAGVVGIPDEDRGEIPKAVVVLTDASEASRELEERLQDHVKQALARHKYPRDIEFADELPRTSTGKVQREKLPDWPPDSSDTA